MFYKKLYINGPLPRVNRKYAPAYNRRSKKAYMRLSKEWEEKFAYIALQIQSQNKGKQITDKIDLLITQVVHPRTDSDAIIKGLFDAMTKSNLIKDDIQINDYLVQRGEWQGEEMVIVKIAPKDELLTSIFAEMSEAEYEAEKAAEY